MPIVGEGPDGELAIRDPESGKTFFEIKVPEVKIGYSMRIEAEIITETTVKQTYTSDGKVLSSESVSKVSPTFVYLVFGNTSYFVGAR